MNLQGARRVHCAQVSTAPLRELPLPQRHRASPPCPAAATPLCDPRSLHLSIKPRPACFGGQNEPGRTVSTVISASSCYIQFPGTDCPIQWVLERVWVPDPPPHTPRGQQENATGGHSEKLLGVEWRPDSLFTHSRELETDQPRKSFGLEAHSFLCLSFSISRV